MQLSTALGGLVPLCCFPEGKAGMGSGAARPGRGSGPGPAGLPQPRSGCGGPVQGPWTHRWTLQRAGEEREHQDLLEATGRLVEGCSSPAGSTSA